MKKKGIGISCNTHPAGMKGGGDPSQAQIRLKPDGTLDLLVGAVDIGQGSKTILRQIAADELGVPLEAITVNNFDTDIAPMSTGTFASRVTFMDGNAVIRAAGDLKKKIKEWAADVMEANPDDIEMMDNKVFVKGVPSKAKTMAEVGPEVNWGGQFLVGTGAFIPGAGQEFDPETGKMTAVASLAYGACVAEVEVDMETGVVEVLKLVQVYEIGKAINPLLCRGQINGGAMMGIGFALSEDFTPNYPEMNYVPDNLTDYVVTTAADMPKEMVWDIVEVPHPDGPRGAKGFSEMTASAAPPAILSAIHDATGIRITDYPATPERILKALTEKKSEG